MIPWYDNLSKNDYSNTFKIVRLGNGLPFKTPTSVILVHYSFYSNNIDFLSRACLFTKNNFCSKLDLIHVHTDGVGFFGFSFRNGLFLSEVFNKPLIISFHQRIGEIFGDLPPKLELYKKYLDKSSQIIVHRRQNLKYFCEWGYKDKTSFIPLPIDIKSFRKPLGYHRESKMTKILYVGRLDYRRGILDLLKAFNLVHKKNNDAELHIVGYGTLEKEAKELTIKYNLDKVVFFHGKKIDVQRYYWDSDIYVSLNISDNYPSLSLREAMSSGLAPIVTDVGETRDVIQDYVNGLLVPLSNPLSLSEAILKLINDDPLGKNFVNAKLSSNSFDISRVLITSKGFIKAVV